MSNQPVPTLYVSNLEGKVKKNELREQLYALFTPYGRVIDVVAMRTGKMRGQAFVVFEEQAAATSAMRALVGEEFYGRPLRITYAKTQSNATRRLLDPENADLAAEASKKKAAKLVVSRAQEEFAELEKERQEEEEGRGKRLRDGEEHEEEDDGDRKKRKLESDAVKEQEEEGDQEMEMDEDEDEAGPSAPVANGTAAAQAASAGKRVQTLLLATSLPPEANEEALSTLFQQYPGFRSIQMLPVGSTPTKSASIVFSSLPQATTAQKALDGFLMKPGWPMGVVVVPADAL